MLLTAKIGLLVDLAYLLAHNVEVFCLFPDAIKTTQLLVQLANPDKVGVVIVTKQGRTENLSCTAAATVTHMLLFCLRATSLYLVEINLAHGYLGIPLT